jgi:hypothetical protein
MATYTPTQHTAAAATFSYAIGFSYERTDDVRVYINGVLLARGTTTSTWAYGGTGNINIVLGAAVNQQDDDIILIKRVTDITDAATIYTAGSGFTYDDANSFINQLLYAIDELQVPAFDSGFLSCATLVTGAADIEYVHSLGALPTRIQIQYKCTSTELGYATGDVITEGQVLIGGTFPVSTTIFTANFETMNDLGIFSTAGVVTQATLSKWSYRILAWR